VWHCRFVQTFLLKSHTQSLAPSSHCFSDSLHERGNAIPPGRLDILPYLKSQLDGLGALLPADLAAPFASVRSFKFLRNSPASGTAAAASKCRATISTATRNFIRPGNRDE
jgi:hypothetical protein